MDKKPVIYEYYDYTEFIKDWFDFQKNCNPTFSLTSFSRKLGFKSKSFVSMLLAGKRKVTRKSIFVFTEAMNLNKKESSYFETLVIYKDCSTDKEKEQSLKKLHSLKPNLSQYQLEIQQFNYFNYWFIPALRELLTYFDFKGDYTALGKKLTFPISAKEAQFGLKTLEDLGMVSKRDEYVTKNGLRYKNKQALYEQNDTHIVTPDKNQMIAIRHYQKENIELATRAFEAVPIDKRRIQTMTIGTSKKGIQEIQELLGEFYQNVVKVVQNNPDTDSVYQLNTQFYPLVKEE